VKPLSASPSTPVEGRLEGWSAAHAGGPEAAAFLQSQLSSDVQSLQVGQSQWSAWLNPKGRVIALILLLRSEEQSFELLLPDHPADSLVPQLSRFILRSKARLAASAPTRFEAGIGTPPPAGALRLGGEVERWLRWQSLTAPAPEERVIDAEWRLQDILCGLPRLGPEGGTHTAHMLGLDRLGAISLSKGCYPGQEIVARTHYLGQSKRGLVCLRLEAGEPPQPGVGVYTAGAAAGEVLGSAVDSTGHHYVQAVASGLQAGSHCECAGRGAEVLELSPAPLPLS
jgi:tRNA-modifying protein YgfZ